jgi:DNA-binding response OmpR family regulator
MNEREPQYELDVWTTFNGKTGEIRDGRRIVGVLPTNEKIVFEKLLQDEDLVVEYEALMDTLYGTGRRYDDVREDKERLWSTIHNLRENIGDIDEKFRNRLVTIREVGYRWDSENMYRVQEGEL